jgi:hypothetical protein
VPALLGSCAADGALCNVFVRCVRQEQNGMPDVGGRNIVGHNDHAQAQFVRLNRRSAKATAGGCSRGKRCPGSTPAWSAMPVHVSAA